MASLSSVDVVRRSVDTDQPRLCQTLVEHIATRSTTMLHPSRRLLFTCLTALLLIGIVIGLLCFNQISSAQAASPNLVNNPGFETGNLNNWTCSAVDSVVSSPAHSGSFALAAAANSSDSAQCTQAISIQANTTYTLSAWVQGNYAFLGVTGTGTNDGNTWTPSAASYTLLSMSFTTGASTTSVTIYVHGWYGQGTVYADDFSMTGPGGGATPTPTSPPSPTATNPPTPTATKTPTPTATPTSGNLVINPGFETGNLQGWACDAGTAQVVSSPVHSGQDALQLNPTSSDDAQCTQTISVQANTTYTLSAWVQGNYAYLGIIGGSSTWTSSSSYTQLSIPFTTGSTTSITIFVHGWYSQGSVYVDDVALNGPGGPPTPTPTPTPTATPTQGPTATPTPSPTPCTNCGGNLPRHLITGYWQDFTNGATPLRLSAVNSNYTIIAVAFANADPNAPGAVTFSIDSGLSSALGGYTTSDFINDIRTLHSQGKKVIISVGGANGTISVNDATSATNFANSVFNLIQTYGFDGVDIDLENGLNPAFMTSALQQLSSKVGSSLIITLAPQTVDMQSTSGSYFQLALNVKNILTIVNMQYYNSGSMIGCDGKVYSEGTEDFLVALACIQLQGGLRPDQVGLGLPASPSAASGGYVSPSVVNAALDCLETGTNCGSFKPSTTYSGMRGAMDWSINWDASNSYNFANAIGPHLSTLP
jgi:chitinase